MMDRRIGRAATRCRGGRCDGLAVGALALLTAAGAPGQAGAAAPSPPAAPQQQAADPDPPPSYTLDSHYGDSQPNGDFRETIGYGGFRFRWPALGLEVLGRNALLLSDREVVNELLPTDNEHGGLPHRDIEPPAPRRLLSLAVLHARVERLLSAFGQGAASKATPPVAFDVLRFLYFEGDVIIVRDGVEVARCERLWISPLDDRLVLEQAELRYTTRAANGTEQLLTVRGPHLEKQGPRWTGRDLSVTTCEAGEAHVAVDSGELELIERDGQFEIRSRGNALQLGGVDVVPLPDAHFFSAEQSAIPLRGIKAGYSSREGGHVRIDVGMPMQGLGGDLHEWLTGRPAHEFRGDWNLGLGWIELRGDPIDGTVTYSGKGLYEGRTEAFYLDDSGPNIREILDNIDGSRIDDRNRNLVRSQNRVFLGDDTHLDLSLFHAGDAAVYSEFFRGDYRNSELPETSVYLHHVSDNVLVTVNGRFQTDSFSYRDNRALAPFFVEELPVATVHWLAQPIATTPWGTPLVLDTATEVGQRRRAVDDRGIPPIAADRTLRVDQLVELSMPIQLGPVQLRPYADARFSRFDDTVAGDPKNRIAFESGVRAGTRLSRTWHWLDEDGNDQAMRHVVAPLITFADRFRVDGDPAAFHQFDDVDALTEQNLVRFEVRNLLQRMASTGSAATGTSSSSAPRDVVLADLAQDLWPNAGRDHQGEHLGLLYYDLQVRSEPTWWPLETLGVGVYGDHDWQNGLRTLDTEVQFGKVFGLDWSLDYRRDAVTNAAAGIGAHAALLGRWDVYGNFSYDFERRDILHYFGGIRRDDHDWSVMAGVNFDPFENIVSFRMEFEPHLFGRSTSRDRNWFGPMPGDALRDSLVQ